jgi:hypothetical protein
LETAALPRHAPVFNATGGGNRGVHGRDARFQLASSWKRPLGPEPLFLPTRLELETALAEGGPAASISPRFGNGGFAQNRLRLQFNLSSKQRFQRAGCPFQSRPELETTALPRNAAVSNSRRVGNEQPCRGQLCFQCKASWEGLRFCAKPPFPTRGELETGSPPVNFFVFVD